MRDKFKERTDQLEPARGVGKVKYESTLQKEVEIMNNLQTTYTVLYDQLLNMHESLS